MNGISRTLLGDSWWRVALRLTLLSFVVGIVMSAIGWDWRDVVDTVFAFFETVWNLGFTFFADIWGYLLLGASVVIPVFILMRVFSGFSRRDG